MKEEREMMYVIGIIILVTLVSILGNRYGYHKGNSEGYEVMKQTTEQSVVYIPVSLETDAECMLRVMEVGESE